MAIDGKVYISGDFHRTDTKWRHYDVPLFSRWTVGWSADASCGHYSCGVDYYTEHFATWIDAVRFTESLLQEEQRKT